ncbi:MAG: acyl-CoA thioesterase [Flavobacteriales bacterium]|nr:acyl-CoA thioesterase [Flavobacteriales bacterium]
MEEPEGKEIFETSVEIRFADIDAMGHVNNAVYFSYFEQARMAYFKERVARIWNWNEDGVIVARNEIDYIYPVFLNDRMNIRLWVEHVGNKSFSVCYRVCATGKSVLFCFNHKEKRPQAIPEAWRAVFIGS